MHEIPGKHTEWKIHKNFGTEVVFHDEDLKELTTATVGVIHRGEVHYNGQKGTITNFLGH